MSNLPDGAFLTSINGRQCTAVPRNPRAAPPERTTAEPAPERTTAQEAPRPTQNNDDNREQEEEEPEQEQEQEPEPEVESQPEPQPTLAPEPSSAPEDEAESSESNLLKDPSPSEADPPNLAILSTTTSASIPSIETQPPEEDEDREDPESAEEEGQPSTSPESDASTPVEEDTQDAEPPRNQGPVSLELPLLAELEGDSGNTALLSTATFLAGVSLASPSVSSFFSSPPPSPTGTGSPADAFPSSFTAILRPSISLDDEDSDSGLLFTDPTPLPDSVITRADGKLTTIGVAATSARDRDGASETNSADIGGGAVQQDRTDDGDSGPNPALIGGVVGGVVGLALIAFLVWFCFRRRQKNKRSRFSRFSTRMSMPPGAEKRKTYEFDSGSVGPTPKRQRFAATLGYHANRFGWGFMLGNQSTSTVNMNRGNSQYIDELPSHSRGNSTVSFDSRANLSRKDRFLDWWSRLKEDVNFNWRLRNGQNDNSWAIRNMMEKDSGDMEPDFLSLLAKDEKRRSMRNSMHSRGAASVSSIDRFLGDLGMDMENTRGPNPFSDTNALPTHKTLDPFADSNVVQPTQKPPNTYVADVRRSRGASVGGAVRASKMSSVYRDSVRSNDSFEVRRNKCRSDPFDLELRHSRLPSNEGVETLPSVDSLYGLPPRPGSLKQGHVSYGSSRYTKASSLGDWSDPGPDIGPSGTVATTNSWTSKVSEGPVVNKRASDGSQSSAGVGKAL